MPTRGKLSMLFNSDHIKDILGPYQGHVLAICIIVFLLFCQLGDTILFIALYNIEISFI